MRRKMMVLGVVLCVFGWFAYGQEPGRQITQKEVEKLLQQRDQTPRNAHLIGDHPIVDIENRLKELDVHIGMMEKERSDLLREKKVQTERKTEKQLAVETERVISELKKSRAAKATDPRQDQLRSQFGDVTKFVLSHGPEVVGVLDEIAVIEGRNYYRVTGPDRVVYVNPDHVVSFLPIHTANLGAKAQRPYEPPQAGQ